MTVAIRSTANASVWPKYSQTTSVIAPAANAMMTRTKAALFARSCVLDLLSCARFTSSMTWLRYVSLPVFSTFLGDRAEGIYDAVPGLPRAAMPGYAGFAERYREADFAVMPEPDDSPAKWAPFGYDAAGVIIAAFRLAAETGAVKPESVAAAMETFRHESYQGVIGTIQFDEVGDLLDQPVYFKKVVNGQWVDVMPGER